MKSATKFKMFTADIILHTFPHKEVIFNRTTYECWEDPKNFLIFINPPGLLDTLIQELDTLLDDNKRK